MPKDNKDIRFDFYEEPRMVESFHEDEDGNLVGRASVTCIGIFPYLMSDGTIFNELRLPEEVFSEDSLNSLRMIPITNEHPIELLTPENTSKYQVGMTGEDVSRFDMWGDMGSAYKTDGTQVTIPLKITDRKTIDEIKGGKRGLSCGYTRQLEVKQGTWCGQHYDGIMRSIRYNHLAVCSKGRAGDAAIICMDSADTNGETETFIPTYTEISDSGVKDSNKLEGGKMPKKVVIDSITYEVEEKVADSYEAIVKERDAIQGKLDMANAQIDSLKTEMSGMIKADELPAKVKELSAIKDTANMFGVSLDDNMSILDMKKAILKVVNPSIADSIDSKSEEYVNGAFSLCDACKPKEEEKKNKDKDEEEEEEDPEKKKKKKGEEPKGKGDSSDEPVSIMDAVNERLQKKFGCR